ncbi:hypothetical protein [Haliangium sp.]|uniref:hypothetical protein n=1 Tax=Haliangium sp. TaxID=2663208 RepID=UPI003D0B3CAC
MSMEPEDPPGATFAGDIAAPVRPDLERAGNLPRYYDWAGGALGSRRLSAMVFAGGIGASIAVGLATTPLLGMPVWAGSNAILAALYRRRWNPGRILRRWSDFRPMTGAELLACADGAPVRMRGRVRPRVRVEGTLAPGDGAWHTLLVHEAVLRQRSVFVERGCDFDLSDTGGPRVRVCVRWARVLADVPSRAPWAPELHTVSRAVHERVVAAVPAAVLGPRPLSRQHLRAWELLLDEGCEVEVLGRASRVIGPGAPALPRETPMQPAIEGTAERPLLIVPAGLVRP